MAGAGGPSARAVSAGTGTVASAATATRPPAPVSTTSRAPPTAAGTEAPAMDAAAAAMARMGISPTTSRSSTPVPPSKTAGTPAGSRTATPAGSRTASPVPSKSGPPAGAFAASNAAVGSATSATSSQNETNATEASFVAPATAPTGSGGASSVPLSKEEQRARKLREQEEAKQKALMRKDKEEIRRMQENAADTGGGIGKTGVAFTKESHVVSLASHFNPYERLSSTQALPDRKFSPIYRVPPFWALLDLNTYIHQRPVPPEKLADRAAMYEQLSRALSFVCYVCAETEKACNSGIGRFEKGNNYLGFLRDNHMACEACIKLISLLPHSAGASGSALDGLFLNFINVFMTLIANLPQNQQMVLPGGWQQPEYTYLVLYIIRNCGNDKFSFTVCNTGRDGLQYHPTSFDPESGRELKQLAMTIWDIPAVRVTDSTFWTLLFRMQVYPSRKNNASFLYTKLLPALNSRPLRSNLDQGPAEYLEMPNKIAAQSYHPLARLALTSSPAPNTRASKYATLLVMNAAVDLAYAEIENAPPHSMDPEDSRILKLTGRNLASFASTINPNTVGDGTLGSSLSDTWDLLDKLLKKINFAASKAMDQYSHGLSASAMRDDFAKGQIVSLKTCPGSAAFPLFGRLRRDNYEQVVKNLMGNPRPDPIVIPAVLTDEKLPPIATDYMTASSSLQRIADACSLLLQQKRLIKNSPAIAASASQYAITTVLPMPNADPKFCFWRKSEMRRETQLNLLFLIRRMCRIYSAATACVQASRGLIAMRSTTLAAGACIADAICRVVAVDDPSTFALHYSGQCEGPTNEFGIEAGAFDTLGSNLPIYNPNMVSLRFQCLDYLRGLTLNMDGTKKNTIFNFDKSLSPMRGDCVLIDQLSIQLALARPFPMTEEAMVNHSANLIAGRNGSLIEVLPEFEYFRDIVFHFKHAVSGKAATPDVPENHTWLPSDSTLHWAVQRRNKDEPVLVFHVKAFQNHHQEFVPRVAQMEKKATKTADDSYFKGFKALFASKTRIERSRLSSADPTTVVNSCGEKFQNKRYVVLETFFTY